jgi:SP family sugar:H+ symporter-like MFS transporter
VASLVWFIPESPRYLLGKGRVEEAKASLRRLRVDNTDSAIDEEVARILLSLEAEKDQGRYSDLWKGTNRRRTLIVCGSNFFLQATGQSFGSAYGTIFIKSLNTINAFDMAVVNQFLRGCAVLSNMYFVDYIGRRTVWMIGTGMQSVCLFIIGGIGTMVVKTTAATNTIVAFSTLNDIFFSGFLAPTNYMITGEMPEQKLRDKTQRVGSWVNIFSK